MKKYLPNFIRTLVPALLLYFGLYEKVNWVENLAVVYFWTWIVAMFVLNSILALAAGLLLFVPIPQESKDEFKQSIKKVRLWVWVKCMVTALIVVALGYVWMGGLYLIALGVAYFLMKWVYDMISLDRPRIKSFSISIGETDKD